MASWKKIIVSGSQAELAAVSASAGILVGSNQQITTSPSTTFLSGSFSGSFQGDGSQLTGLGGGTLVVSASHDGGNTNGVVDLGTQALTISGGEGLDVSMAGQTLTVSAEDASSSNKGVASFDSGDFVVTSGNVTLADLTTGAVLTIAGTTNETTVSRTNGTVTVGLPDNVVITQNLTVGGDLIVQGSTTVIQTTNLEVEDRYILLNSGSVLGAPAKGGIVVDKGSGSGYAFIVGDTATRWGFTGSLASNAATATPDAFAAAVIDIVAGHSDIAEYQKRGNIKVDSDESIWVYS